MKNLILRQGLLNREVYLYEVAIKLHVGKPTLEKWLHYEWHKDVQNELLKFIDGNSDYDYKEIRAMIYRTIHRDIQPQFGSSGAYAAKVMNYVMEWELRKEKEREGWY